MYYLFGEIASKLFSQEMVSIYLLFDYSIIKHFTQSYRVETDSQSGVVDRVVGSSPSSLRDESSPETEFIPE